MGIFGRKKLGESPLAGIDTVLADLDGVIYRGKKAIPGAVEAINRVAEAHSVGYLTNNAARTDFQVAELLQGLGVHVTPEQIVTSPQAAIELLAKHVQPGALILVVGGEGITYELEKAGYRWTRKAADNPDAVLQGFTPDLAWRDLAEASYALQEIPGQPEIPWIATNTDWTIPQEQGLAPGNGTMVSAVHTAVQRLPEFAGKPETAIFNTAKARFGGQNVLMIGDRLDTDVRGADAAGLKSALVLTGVDRPKQLLAAGKGHRPTWIVPTIADLFEPYPETIVSDDGAVSVGGAKVKMRGHIVEIKRKGDDELNLLRAACGAIYRSGLLIYGLEVPEELTIDHWYQAPDRSA